MIADANIAVVEIAEVRIYRHHTGGVGYGIYQGGEYLGGGLTTRRAPRGWLGLREAALSLELICGWRIARWVTANGDDEALAIGVRGDVEGEA